MYLTDRDIKWAIENGDLIIDPLPETIDPTSVDLHLAPIADARIWDIAAYAKKKLSEGIAAPELRIAKYSLKNFGEDYLAEPPEYVPEDLAQLVGRRGKQIIVKPGGFLLWPTKERVGTPSKNADLICFVDGKSTRARAGIIVHLTAHDSQQLGRHRHSRNRELGAVSHYPARRRCDRPTHGGPRHQSARPHDGRHVGDVQTTRRQRRKIELFRREFFSVTQTVRRRGIGNW